MHIGHVAPVIYPVPPRHYGGTERVIADLAREQVAAGHEVTLFAAADSSLDQVHRVGDYHSIAWHRRQAEGDLPPGLPAELEAQQLRDLLKRAGSCDVLHVHGSAHASAVAASLGLPAFRTIHWRADEADHREHFAGFPQERVIAISNAQASDVPPSSLAGVVHHGIPVDRLSFGSGSGGYLAFLGRMTDQKRPDRAISLAQATGLDLKLAGPVDPGNPGYFARVVEPELDHSITHIGLVDERGKQTLLGGALALVFPIDWPEPFGLVMIEAMACGTPVIAWRRGSAAEIVDNGLTGFVVDSMAEALERMNDIRLLDRKAIRATFERRFGADRMARETLALYRRALTGAS
ncbi:glycosyltransferase family 4 protein [Aurantiacibacter spongiae]|uniref:Glycosyltransferase family 4 protein n=1 Tax=Aurantiacibacter spongiae TaxID=2488860 RepID=A0A3N5CWL3_9SPHN|nr:glycosyltransferase family 4 protein [Aurantiacibacter spongiae]RPF71029.1 glycosyltransferase family 4 protein [Aurantiacibacter spongiae]